MGVHTAWLAWLEQGGWWPLQSLMQRRIPPATDQVFAVDRPATEPAWTRPAVAVFLDQETPKAERERVADLLADGPWYGGAQPPSPAVHVQRVRVLFEAAAAARQPQRVRDADDGWYRRADGTIWNDPPERLPARHLRRCFPRLVRAALHHRPAGRRRSEQAEGAPDPLTMLLDREDRRTARLRLEDLFATPEARALLQTLSPTHRETLETRSLPPQDAATDLGISLGALYTRRARLKKALEALRKTRR